MFNNSNEWNKQFQGFLDEDFWDNFNRYFSGGNNEHPKYNLYQSENELICIIFLPGVKYKENLKLNINGGFLEITGMTTVEYQEYQLLKEELGLGSFNRMIELPFSVRKDKIDAYFKDGLLEVHLYKLIPDNNNYLTIKDK
jgi:HSP20 family protein